MFKSLIISKREVASKYVWRLEVSSYLGKVEGTGEEIYLSTDLYPSSIKKKELMTYFTFSSFTTT